MVKGITTEAVYLTPEVVVELGVVLKYLNGNGLKVGGALSEDTPRPAETLNDAVEWLIEQALLDGLYHV